MVRWDEGFVRGRGEGSEVSHLEGAPKLLSGLGGL